MKVKIEIGGVYNTNEGGSITILKYNSAKDIDVIHNDKYGHIRKVSACSIRRGSIRNPYKPVHSGVGYMGVGEHLSKNGSLSVKSSAGFGNYTHIGTFSCELEAEKAYISFKESYIRSLVDIWDGLIDDRALQALKVWTVY